MKLLKKLQKDKKFILVVICLVLALFLIPYLTIPGMILWWFVKTKRISRMVKIITISLVGSMFVLLVGMIVAAGIQNKDTKLIITEPVNNTTTKDAQIIIKGTYYPSDRTVLVNDERVSSINGRFQTTYQLNEGKNHIVVAIGGFFSFAIQKVDIIKIIYITQTTKEFSNIKKEKTKNK